MKKLPKVGIIGTGFVGTACSTGFETLGVEVREYDKYKPSESLWDVVDNSDILFVCVPTPMNEDGWCDISIVQAAVKDIVKTAKSRKIIVVKSTVEPGTTEELASCYADHAIVFNPEFLTEKNFINDFLEQDRIILGTTSSCTKKDVDKLKILYEAFTTQQKNPATIREVPSDVAEMAKYAANSFLATKVAFFNEIYDICSGFGTNYEQVASIVSLDKRIGKSHTQVPGPDGFRGFGGKCFPKDLNGLIALAEAVEVDPAILEAVWFKNLEVREKQDWKEIKGATTECSYDET